MRHIRRQNGLVYSESSISRQYAVLYNLRIFDSVKRCFQLSPTSHQPSKRLLVLKDMPTESFDVVGRPSQLLAHAKMLFPIRFFFSCARKIMLWKVLHFFLSRCDFSRLFHTGRSWYTYRFAVVFFSFLVGKIYPLMQESLL